MNPLDQNQEFIDDMRAILEQMQKRNNHDKEIPNCNLTESRDATATDFDCQISELTEENERLRSLLFDYDSEMFDEFIEQDNLEDEVRIALEQSQNQNFESIRQIEFLYQRLTDRDEKIKLLRVLLQRYVKLNEKQAVAENSFPPKRLE